MSDVKVVREPLTYEPGAPVSYFRDLALAHADASSPATDRLQRHAAELDVELPIREQRARAAAAAAGLELRTNPNTDGPASAFAPPLWLLDRFATAPRAGRVLASLIPRLPLPGGVQSVNLPRLTTGTSVQAGPDLHAEPSSDIADAITSSPVVTLTGQGDVALQLLEQSPAGAHLDAAVFKDLTGSYASQLETLLVAGSGTAGQFTGLLGAASASNAVTYTDGSPTGSKMWPFVGQVAARIGNNRLMPPEIWLARTSRWAWIASSEDAQGLPLATAESAPAPVTYGLDDAQPRPVAAVLGWPLYVDDAIPATLGAGGNQDAFIGCRPSDMLLLESAPRTAVQLEVLSGTLQARLQLHAYAAALVGRYPSGIGTLTGSGMAIAAGF